MPIEATKSHEGLVLMTQVVTGGKDLTESVHGRTMPHAAPQQLRYKEKARAPRASGVPLTSQEVAMVCGQGVLEGLVCLL